MRKTAHMNIAVAAVAAALLLSAVAARSADDREGTPPKAGVTFDAESFFVGEPFIMTVLIDGSDIVEKPDLSALRGSFSARFLDETELKIKGKTGYAIRYKLVPKKAGKATIPPLRLTVDASIPVKTAPATIDVGIPERDPGIRIEARLSKTKCRIGEPVLLKVSWISSYPFSDYRAVDIALPALTSRNFEVRDERGDPLKRPGAISLPVSNTRIIATVSKSVIDGVKYNVISFEKILVPKKSGRLGIRPATIVCAKLPSNPRRRGRRGPQYPAFFNNDFFKQPPRGKYQLRFAESKPLALEVEPLPEKNRPNGFLGVVGKFAVSADADRTDLSVGDPITVTFTARTDNPLFLDNAKPPPLGRIPAVANNFTVSEPWFLADGGGRDKTVFSATIIPKTTRIKTIPSFEMPYFDPDAGKYGVAATAPIPITVKPARAVTALDAELSSGGTIKNLIVKRRDGIHGNDFSSDALTSRRNIPGTWLAAVAAFPPLAFLIFLFATAETRLARKDPAAARSKYALRRFRRKASAAALESDSRAALKALERAVREYFADKFDTLPYAHTGKDVEEALASVPGIREDALEAIALLYSALDAERFGGEKPPESVAGLPRSIPRAIAAVDAAIGWKKPPRRGNAALAAAVTALLLPLAALSAPFGASAADSAPLAKMSDAEILKKANGIFEDANEMALKRPDAAIPVYLQAAMKYRYLVEKRGVDTAALHKNAGNAFLLAGDIGRAVLEYERAKALDPSDADNNDNLRYAKSLAMDDTGETLPAIVASRVFFWHFWPYDVRFALFAVAWTALWILAGVLAFNAKRPVRWSFAAALVLSLMFGLSALATEFRAFDSVDAVVVAKKAIARKGNSDIYAEAFTSPLHAGTECSIIERRGKWFHVELPAGERCWLPENALELVDR